jgi:hypothetical protein
MQRMKPDAATAGIVDRICQQMIEVHHHRRKHDQKSAPPLLAKKQPGDNRRYGDVKQ